MHVLRSGGTGSSCCPRPKFQTDNYCSLRLLAKMSTDQNAHMHSLYMTQKGNELDHNKLIKVHESFSVTFPPA